MKLCCYCGRENDVHAVVCSECGGDNLRRQDEPPPLEDTLAQRLANPVFLFRSLILISFAGYAMTYVEHFWGFRLLSAESRTLLECDGYGSPAVIPVQVFHLQSILYVTSLIGLYWFVDAARILYACLLLAFTFQCLLGGLTVQTPLGGFVGYVATLAAGAILAMAYSGPLKSRFH